MQASAEELRSIIRGLNSDIRSSWVRCLESYKLAPTRIKLPQVVTRNELIDQSDPIEDLLALAAPEIKRLFARLMDSDYLITIASKDGVNVAARCDYQLIGRMESKGLTAGAVWTEELQGTNGVGTCIKLGRPLSVVRSDHFSAELKNLSCSVVPIFGPGMSLRCILNATTDRQTDHVSERILLSVLQKSARRIENVYFGKSYGNTRILRLSADADFADPSNEFWIALDNSEVIIDATSAVREVLGMDRAQLLGRSVSDVLHADMRRWAPLQPVWLPSERPGQNSVFAILNETRAPLASSAHPAGNFPRLQPVKRAQTGAISETVFALSPDLVSAFPKAVRLVQAGLPVVLQGERGSGRQAFATLLAAEAGRQSCHVLRCGIEQADHIARRIIEAEPGDTVFLEDAELLPAHLAQAVARLSGKSGTQAFGGVSLIIGCSEKAMTDAMNTLMPVMTINLPPLRHYPNPSAVIDFLYNEEIQALRKMGLTMSSSVAELLRNATWPGNMQEVRLAIRHMLALCEGDQITIEHLPRTLRPTSQNGAETFGHDLAERHGLQSALALNDWNVSRTADYLGISRATLNRKIRCFSLVRPTAKGPS